MSFAYMTALELKGLLAERSISPVELVDDTLARQEALEPRINAFVNRTPEQALAAAREAERAIAAGEGGAIAGLPVSVKDLVAVAGVPWTFGSRPFADNIPDFDAPSVERVRAAGGCIIGKSTTSEFGCKAVTDSPLSGITRNPWNLAKTPGGSSGGGGASVAAGLTPFAVCTDGGGSIRIPSALCGLFGIKAQFGRVPLFPVPAAPTLSHVGAIARTVRDAALLLGVMAGHDRRDAFGVAEPVPDFLAACDEGAGGLHIAWSPTLGYATPDPEVAALCEAAARRFEALGCTVELVEDALGADPVELWMAEFYGGIGTKLKDLMAEHGRTSWTPPWWRRSAPGSAARWWSSSPRSSPATSSASGCASSSSATTCCSRRRCPAPPSTWAGTRRRGWVRATSSPGSTTPIPST